MNHPKGFTEAEMRLLRMGDAVIDADQADETPAQREARYSRESRERRRLRMGDDAYRAMCRDRLASWKARRRAH